MDLIADTSFLVGLWRSQAWATRFARSRANHSLGIPWVVLGEFWHGALRANHDADRVRAFLQIGRPVLEVESVIPRYAQMCVRLQETNAYQQIGQNDLWIAAVALTLDRPLVSRNVRHFRAVEGLRLEIPEP